MSSSKAAPYDPKNMKFRHLGPAGMQVALFSLGGWLTYGGTVDQAKTTEIIKVAWENGINTFDTAEVYAAGESEKVMGQAIRDLGLPREDLVLTTKIFFGTGGKTPNSRGLSRKHIIEGTNASCARAQLDYWDVIHCHRPDHSVSMEEIVRAFNYLIDTGKCFYWATSEWSAQQIQEAHTVAARLGMQGPVADQPQYHLLHRERVEKEYEYLYREPYKLGLTTWSPLASGLLTGKYNDGIPADSRFATNSNFFKNTVDSLQTAEGKAKIEKVRKLTALAQSELGTTPTVLALAWVAKNPNVSTVILGATKPEQVVENLKALDIIDKLTPEIMQKIDDIFQNKPEENPKFGR